MISDINFYEFAKFLINIHDDRIKFTGHVEDKIKDRGLSKEVVKDLILYETPVGMLKQDLTKFKVYYPFPDKESTYDLIIILAIDNNTKVLKPVTTYQQTIKRRVRRNGKGA